MSSITPPLLPGGPGGNSILNNQTVVIGGVTWTAQNFNVSGATPYSLLVSGTSLRFQALTGQNDPDFDSARVIRTQLTGAQFPCFTPITFGCVVNWASNTPYPTTNDFNTLMQLHGLDNDSPCFEINILPDGSGGELMQFTWNYQTPSGAFVFSSLGSIPFLRNKNYNIQHTYVDGHGYNLGSLVLVVNGVTVVNSGTIVTGHALAIAIPTSAGLPIISSYPSFGDYCGVVSGVPAAQNNVVSDLNPTFSVGATPAIPFSYYDGTLGKPTIAAGAQYPGLLNVYAARPSWQVAGVDYAVGIPDAKKPLINPITSPPANTTRAGNTITVTADNVYLDGYDFSVGGGQNLVCVHDRLNIINCNFGGANLKTLTNGVVEFTGQYCAIRYCNINGGFAAAGAASSPAALLYFNGSNQQQITIQYCYLSGCASTVIHMGNAAPLNCQYNFFDNVFIASGKTMNYVTWDSGGAEIIRVIWQFNTSRQTLVGAGAGDGTTFFDANAANVEFFGLVCQYNTAVAPGGTPGTVMSYIFSGNPSAAKIGSQSFVGFNYADPSGATGFYQPGTWTSTAGITVHPSINMVTGATVNPSTLLPAFYIASAADSPPGNDGNAGTITAPFLTFPRAATAMNGSAIKTTYVRAGTYNISSPWIQDSNQAYIAYPLDTPFSAILNFSTTLSGNSGTGPFNNITLYGLVFNGNVAATTDPIFQWSATNNLVIQDCRFTVTTTMGSLHIYNPNGLRLQGCSFSAPSNNGNNHFSITINDHSTHDDNIVNSNTLVGCGRFPIEWQCINSEILTNNHCDYNTISNWQATGAPSPAGAIGISFVGAKSTSNSGNTCSHNTLTEPAGNSISNLYGIEIDVWGVTCQANSIANVTVVFLVGKAGQFLQNTMTSATNSWLDDGGGSYDATSVQIGNNTVNGVARAGCTAPGLCGLTPAPSGSQPIWPPSTPFTG